MKKSKRKDWYEIVWQFLLSRKPTQRVRMSTPNVAAVTARRVGQGWDGFFIKVSSKGPWVVLTRANQ